MILLFGILRLRLGCRLLSEDLVEAIGYTSLELRTLIQMTATCLKVIVILMVMEDVGVDSR